MEKKGIRFCMLMRIYSKSCTPLLVRNSPNTHAYMYPFFSRDCCFTHLSEELGGIPTSFRLANACKLQDEDNKYNAVVETFG